MASKKVLITGVSGFVGPYLARQLLENGHEVTGLVMRRADYQRPKRLVEMGLISNIRLIGGDVTNLASLLTAIYDVQPDWIFHLAAQTFVPESFKDPLGTFRTNCLGTQHLLESVRLRAPSSRILFAGSSEEYGLQFYCQAHYERLMKKYGVVEPPPTEMPEIPINEQGFMRPMSPYATSKVYGDYAFRNYHTTYGLDTVISRAFNHEGAGRGHNFVTSTIVRQLVSMQLEELAAMKIGDVQSFRDWSHILDIVDGYTLLADRASSGSTYVLGSMRSHSVLSYILYVLSALGHEIKEICNIKGEKKVRNPLESTELKIGNATIQSNVIDQMLLSNSLSFDLDDVGLNIVTNKRKFKVEFDPNKFRPSDVPVLMSNINKVKKVGFTIKRDLLDIVNDQINYYLDPVNRKNLLAD